MTRKPKASPDLDAVSEALRAIFAPFESSFTVTRRKGHYALDDNSVRGWSVSFGAVVSKARAVSFYLMSGVYTPSLLDGMSAALAAHRKKAGFFNFTSIEPAMFAELSRFTQIAAETWDVGARVKR